MGGFLTTRYRLDLATRSTRFGLRIEVASNEAKSIRYPIPLFIQAGAPIWEGAR